VSVVVPTHNRRQQLGRLLGSLQLQTLSPDCVEVIVVDDGSECDVSQVVTASTGPIELTYVRQPLTGVNGARNCGAQAAHGKILAFLDDDTVVSPEWAEAIKAAFDQYECAAVGGRVKLSLAHPVPDWLSARSYYLAEYDLGSVSRWVQDGHDPLPVGANCAVLRSEFDRLGGFRPGLDRIGDSLRSNGDTELFGRVRAAGGRIRYEPKAQVTHVIPPERLTERYFARRSYAQGVSDELLLKIGGERPDWSHHRMLARGLFRATTSLCRDLVRGRRPVNGALEIGYWAGRLTTVAGRSNAVARTNGPSR